MEKDAGMRTIYSEDHRLHAPATEFSGEGMGPPYEVPDRVERILARVRDRSLGPVAEPAAVPDLDPILKVHREPFVRFLREFWPRWLEDGGRDPAVPWVMPSRGHGSPPPDNPHGQLGYYAFSADTAMTEGTWTAALAAAGVALTATGRLARDERGVFALCRPPGHHAAADLFGGYCFLNNAAIAAQSLLDSGATRVALLDVDFHHGNGTQAIFYDRPDVLFLSLHGDPRQAFPFFWGHADETGAGPGAGANANYPLPPGTDYARWNGALEDACARIVAYAPDALVVSLGVDTYKDDPISFFRLESDDFTRVGARLKQLRLPTVFVMEGGYAVEAIGVNTVNVLQGFEGG